jgi:heterogeneous nuclear rnp K-like protein 2
MSASPTATAHSAKRPLEEPSSPSAPTDQPDAKRPALDKVMQGDNDEEKPVEETSATEVDIERAEKPEGTNGVTVPVTDAQGDTVVTEAPQQAESNGTTQVPEDNASEHMKHDETGWIHIRAVISSAEAATVIGKGGENVSTIRKMSGAKCTVSDYQKGAVERILTVSGVVDAVAKVSYLFLKSVNLILTVTRLLAWSSVH